MFIQLRRGETDHGRQRGFSLVEMLIAVTIFAIAVGVAFVLYNAAQHSYKEGEQFTEMQQNTRVAFGWLVRDLRMAGFNYNPDGDLTRPDEQIEGAWDTAITIRGDFDFEITPADNAVDNNVTPEDTLKGGAFNVVSTGNSEIVTFALGKPDGSGGVDLIFNADVEEAVRDGDVEEVRIEGMHLDQSSPPYTLYRITLNNDETQFGNWGTFAVKQPVVDNIKSLTFRYFDSLGNQLNTFDLTQTADDIGGDEAAGDVATRASIRRVEIDLVGLTPDPDLDYLDPTDAIAATQNYRKFELETDISMANLGFTGMVDNILGTPRPPQNVTACLGHCEGILVEWENPVEVNDAVSGYTLWYGTDPSVLDTPVNTNQLYAWVGNLAGGPYYFGVNSVNGSGIKSAIAGPITATPANDTRPLPPADALLWASGGSDPGHPTLESRIDLGWGMVTENINQGASQATSGCDPQRPVNRDLAGYQVFRGESSGFAETTPLALPGGTVWSDNAVVNCRNYYYAFRGVDKCGLKSDPSGEVQGFANTTIPPAPPVNVWAVQTSSSTIDVTWDPVTENTNSPPDPISVDYNIYVAEANKGTDPNSISDGSYFLAAGPVAGSLFQHLFSFVSPSDSLYFKVTAVDDCPNESVKSSGAESTCNFSGTLVYDLSDGANVAGIVRMLLDVSGPQSYVRGLIRIREALTGSDVYYEETWTKPFVFPDWNSVASAPGLYEVIYEAENSKGCIVSQSIFVQVNPVIACCVGAVNPETLPVGGKASDQNKKLAFDIANRCGGDIEIIGINIEWTNTISGNAKTTGIEYPTGTLVHTFSPSEPTGAFADFLAVPLFLSMFNDSVSPLPMLISWDGQIGKKDPVTKLVASEIITLRYDYKLILNSNQGFCIMDVKPEDGTVVEVGGS